MFKELHHSAWTSSKRRKKQQKVPSHISPKTDHDATEPVEWTESDWGEREGRALKRRGVVSQLYNIVILRNT